MNVVNSKVVAELTEEEIDQKLGVQKAAESFTRAFASQQHVQRYM